MIRLYLILILIGLSNSCFGQKNVLHYVGMYDTSDESVKSILEADGNIARSFFNHVNEGAAGFANVLQHTASGPEFTLARLKTLISEIEFEVQHFKNYRHTVIVIISSHGREVQNTDKVRSKFPVVLFNDEPTSLELIKKEIEKIKSVTNLIVIGNMCNNFIQADSHLRKGQILKDPPIPIETQGLRRETFFVKNEIVNLDLKWLKTSRKLRRFNSLLFGGYKKNNSIILSSSQKGEPSYYLSTGSPMIRILFNLLTDYTLEGSYERQHSSGTSWNFSGNMKTLLKELRNEVGSWSTSYFSGQKTQTPMWKLRKL